MANGSPNIENNNLKELDKIKKQTGYASFQSQLQHSFHHSDQIREEAVDQYQESWLYYRALRPALLNGNQDGSSVSSKTSASHMRGYVQPVLRDTVDSVMPSLMNIFCENEVEAVKYRPTSKYLQNGVAEAVNKTINNIFLRENNGYDSMYDIMLEGLVTGDCYTKVYLCEELIEEEIEFKEPVPLNILDIILEDFPDTDIEQFKLNEEKGTLTTDGIATLSRLDRNIKVDYIPWGEVYVDALATNLEDARYVCHRTLSYVGIVKEQFPGSEEVIEAASTIQALGEADTSNLKLETLQQHVNKDDDYKYSIDPAERPIYLYEHFIYSSYLSDDDKSKLYRVYGTDTDILSIDEVDTMSLVHGKPISLPDSYWGISLHSLCKHEQDKLSELTRMISDSGSNATRGRYIAVKGQYDRRSLLDNRPGGVVEVNTPNVIDTFPYHPLPVAVESLYAKISDNAQTNKGNAVGLGLEHNLNNVAASTVAMAVQNSEMKDKKIAKQLAHSLIKPMFEKIYNLIKEENLPLDYPDGYEGVKFTGSQLPKRSEFVIDVNTSNDSAREAGQLMSVLQTESTLSNGESSIMGEQERYEIYCAALTATGIVGAEKFLKDPSLDEATPEEVQEQELVRLASQRAQEIAIKQAEAELAKTIAETVQLQSEIERSKEASVIDFKEVELKQSELDLEAAKINADIVMTTTYDKNISLGSSS